MAKNKKKEVQSYLVKYDNVKDYKILWPGDKPGNDTTKKYISITNVALASFVFWLISSVFIFVMLWRPLPYLPFPEYNPFKHFYIIPWLLSWLGEGFDSSYARSYQHFVLSLKSGYEIFGFIGRFIFTVIATVGAAYFGAKLSWRPWGGITHKKGKMLLEREEAYNDLYREFGEMAKYGSTKLIAGASVPFNPMVDTIESLKENRKTKNGFIERPLEAQKTMTIITGGTGRGKTNLIYYLYLTQMVNRIKQFHDRRLIILDTVKGDYQKYFEKKEDYYLIAPQKKMSEHWAIAKDINNGMLAKSFMQGKIPQNEASQEIWNPAATTIGTGCIVLLQNVAPLEWTLGHLSYVLNKTGAELKDDLWNVYPESRQILSGAKETVASVITTLGTYKDDLMEIARLMDGYDTKHHIIYSTAKTLRMPSYLEWLKTEFNKDCKGQGEEQYDKNGMKLKDNSMVISGYRGKGFLNVVSHMNTIEGKKDCWTWKDMVAYIKTLAPENLIPTGDDYSEKIFASILQFHEEWDTIERRKLLSLRDWITNPQTVNEKGLTVSDRAIMIIQPFQDSPSLTKGLIKGMLYVMNKIILGLKDTSKDIQRDITMLIDEFATYNGIEEFVRESFSLWRSKGVDITIALQDFSMLEDIGYSQAFIDFLISNVGNLIIVGHNAGKTSQTMQDMLGERTITKVHKSVGSGGGGKNINTEIQEHQEVVVHSSVFNTLGANIPKGKIKYLYLAGKLNPVYLLEAPLIKYPSFDTGEIQDRLTPNYQPIHHKKLENLLTGYTPKGQGGQVANKEGTVATNQENTFDKKDETEKSEVIEDDASLGRRK